MRISTKGRYGLTVVVVLGAKYGEGPIPLRQIAEEQNLSEAYLEQLIPPLRHQGILKSVRGAYGGYMLAKPPEEITSGDVIRILEGPIQPIEGLEDTDIPQYILWKQISDAVKEVLDTTTIADLVDSNQESNIDSYMFYI